MPEVNEQQMSAVDRELSQLLAVEPSPEFAARVRTRIEQQPARRFAWWPWAGASLAAAAVIVAAVVIGAQTAPAVVAPASVPADIHLSSGEVALQPRTPVHAIPVVTPVARAQRAVRSEGPEIVIDPSLAAAIRRLASEQPLLPEVPREPSLDPVVVEPLIVPEIGEFGGAGL
jgi:hypothetical protein